MLDDSKINLLEKLHSEQILHNGLSPSSIVLGRTLHNPRLYLVDFKHSLKLLDGKHMEVIMDQGLEGEAHQNIDEFSSVNKTLKMLQSKKDELESVLYILIYIHRGGTLTSKTYDKSFSRKSLFDIAKWKAVTSPEVICEDLPECFALYLMHLRSLNGQERPNYKFLRSLFLKSITGNKFTKSLSEILAFDMIRMVAEHKSKASSIVDSSQKATLPSERTLRLDEDIIMSDEETHPMPPAYQSAKSIRDIVCIKPISSFDAPDDDYFKGESITQKISSLGRFPSAK